MIQPNSDCAAFCYWLLNISWQKLSTTQRLLVETIQTAALANVPVTQQQWNNFNLFTAWRYPYYLVYAENSAISNPSLLTDLVYAADFEGNSNDLVGSNNGTDTNATYGLPYGRVLQGFSSTSQTTYITTSNVLPGSTYSVNIWYYLSAPAPLESSIWSDTGINYGFRFVTSTNNLLFVNGEILQHVVSNPYSVWHMATLTTSPAGCKMYLDGVLVDSSSTPMNNSGLNRFGNSFANYHLIGNLDCPAVWSRVLSQDDIDLLYNSGLGLQYPF